MLAARKTDNRRSRPRLSTQMVCWYRATGNPTFRKTRLCDLSESGAGLYAPDLVGEGVTIDLTLRLGQGSYLSLSARAVWQRPCPCGALLGLEFQQKKSASVGKWLGGQRAMKLIEGAFFTDEKAADVLNQP